MNLAQKLIEIRKTIDSVHRDTEAYGYSYVSGTQVISKVRAKMDELSVLIIPQIHGDKTGRAETLVEDKNGQHVEQVIFGPMEYLLIDADNPEDTLLVPWFFVGQQKDASQAFGSGLTYAERYYLMKGNLVPTDEDDPDALKGGRQSGKSTKTKSDNPECPKCNSSVHVIKAKYHQEKGEWLCWKKKDEKETGCGFQFDAITEPQGKLEESIATPPSGKKRSNKELDAVEKYASPQLKDLLLKDGKDENDKIQIIKQALWELAKGGNGKISNKEREQRFAELLYEKTTFEGDDGEMVEGFSNVEYLETIAQNSPKRLNTLYGIVKNAYLKLDTKEDKPVEDDVPF